MSKTLIKLKFVLLVSLFLVFLPVFTQDHTSILSQRLDLADGSIHFTIAYPENWLTSIRRGEFVITELQEDHENAFEDNYTRTGYVIQFEKFSLRELRNMDINLRNASLEEVSENFAQYQGMILEEAILTDFLLGLTAVHLSGVDNFENHIIFLAIMSDNEFIVLRLFAPSEDALATFLPTRDLILDSIQISQGNMTVGDYIMPFSCMGEGSPTVILEGGWLTPSTTWSPVIQGVAPLTQICVTTRNSALGIVGIDQHVSDLHNFLQNAEIEPPYVLVGHSYGGMVARVYADEYPDEILGMVLVDSSHEDQLTRFIGVMAEIDPDLVIPLSSQAEIVSNQVAETGSLGDMPLTVVTAEIYGMAATEPFAAELEQYFRPIWNNELQLDLASLSTRGRQIIVPNTTHITIIYNPATTDAIREVVETIRLETAP